MEQTANNNVIHKLMTYELLELFTICPPSKLKQNIEDTLFSFLLDNQYFDEMKRKELVSSTYQLLKFLAEADKICKANAG